MVENGALQEIPKSDYGCKWDAVTLQVFNQKTQRLKFNYKKCPKYMGPKKYSENVIWAVTDGNIVTVEPNSMHPYSADMPPNIIMGIWKLGASNEREFLENLLAPDVKNCRARQSDSGEWSLGITKAASMEMDIDAERPDDFPYHLFGNCKLKGFTKAAGWRFTIHDGIVFAYDKYRLKDLIYDINSVVYENRG